MHILAARALTAPDDEAVPLFQATLALRNVDRWPFETARVSLALGELYRRRHRPGDARPELRRAAEVFARIGAGPWQQRAEQELRLAGVAIQTPFASPHDLLPAVELTAQQLEVARLAARGLSNKAIAERLFLSPRTVSAHLYRIFPKLGITSRSALRDALDVLTPTG
jgi:DNA-binding CsgD family transcriptional regulator